MHDASSTRRYARSIMAVLALLAGAFQAHGTDTYDTASHQLQIPSLWIGGGTYSNVVLTIGSVVTPPSGTSWDGTLDTYDPANNQLTVPAVQVGSTTYDNAVATVAHLTSIGSVSGADMFDGTYLHIPFVQVGPKIYDNVVLAVSLGNVAKVNGGMPSISLDQFSAANGQLLIPAVQANGQIYTNVILNVVLGDVVSVGNVESVGVTVLFSFGAAGDGTSSTGSLIQASDGNFYAMNPTGGANGVGTVFKITPAGTASVLHSFSLSDGGGYFPGGGSLIQASDGNLYGTTVYGGASDNGAVIKITLAGAVSVLYSFGSVAGDGLNPRGSLIQASDGNFYGMTNDGGANTCRNHDLIGSVGCGTVIKITLAGTESVLHSFGSAGDGFFPGGSLIQASDGNFYGITPWGGANGVGTVFNITSAGTESVLHSFSLNSNDGGHPYDNLIQASDGNLYGAGSGGAFGAGAVMKFTLTGTESVFYSFSGGGNGLVGSSDGGSPGGLLQASDGNFYGMTSVGGAINAGTVFKITPAGTESVLHSFGSFAGDGRSPGGNLIQASDGNLYGVTDQGGAYNLGTVIQIIR